MYSLLLPWLPQLPWLPLLAWLPLFVDGNLHEVSPLHDGSVRGLQYSRELADRNGTPGGRERVRKRPTSKMPINAQCALELLKHTLKSGSLVTPGQDLLSGVPTSLDVLSRQPQTVFPPLLHALEIYGNNKTTVIEQDI